MTSFANDHDNEGEILTKTLPSGKKRKCFGRRVLLHAYDERQFILFCDRRILARCFRMNHHSLGCTVPTEDGGILCFSTLVFALCFAFICMSK